MCVYIIIQVLTPDSFFSQGRQKLARFNAREFATLIIDILSDAKRRQQGKGLSSPTGETLGGRDRPIRTEGPTEISWKESWPKSVSSRISLSIPCIEKCNT